MARAKTTLNAVIEDLLKLEISMLETAARCKPDENHWDRGEARGVSRARKKIEKLRATGKTRIV